MKPVVVVEGDEPFDSLFEFLDVGVLLEIDFFIFEGSEEPFVCSLEVYWLP